MADYYQVKNQNIFNPPANTSLGNATNQFNNVYIENDLVLGNVIVTPTTIITPKVSSITYPGDDTAADPAGGQTITLTGSGFAVGATVLINNVEVSVVSVVSSTSITFTSPANSTGSYVLYVINTDGGTAIAIPGIQYSGTPTWTTAAGSLGNVYETVGFNQSVTATGDAPITYSVYSGTLPPGATFNSNGTITGTSEVLSSPTTYTFTVRATDAELQDTNRTFSLTINPDVVTWASPANGTTYTSAINSAISNVTLSATSAVGSGITYTANALPTGLSLSGNTISGTPTVEANSSSLLTATANTTSESSNITINWVINVANDMYFEYNTLLIPGASSTFVDDASTNNFAVTIAGDTKPNSLNPYTPGYYSNQFNTQGQYLTFGTSSTLALGAGSFTVELWVNLTSYNASTSTLIDWRTAGDAGTNVPSWSIGASGILDIYLNILSGPAVSSSSAIPLNTWTHIACVRNGTALTLYFNGVSVGTGSSSINCSIETFRVNDTQGSYYTNGYISNLRIVKGTAVYTGAFTPSTAPLTAISNTVLLTCQSNRFIDNSTNNFTVTVGGATQIKSFQPFTSNSSYSTYGSGYFDGTGDYLNPGTSTSFAFGTGDFTVECWIYATAASDSPIYEGRSDGDTSNGFTITAYSSSVIRVFSGSALISSSTAYLNSWTHVAVCRVSGTTTLYINGVSAGTTSSLGNITSTSSLIGAGRYVGGATISNYFTGYISNFRVVKGTAVYTTAFTPPTSPLTAISGTSLLTLQNNQSVNNNVFLDNSTNNFLITRNGNPTQGTYSPYGGNWSNYFDGTGDYLSVPNDTAFNFGNANFTFEMWLFPLSTGNYWIAGKGDASSASGSSFSFYNGSTWDFYYGSSAVAITKPTLTLNAWQHIAVVRNSTTITIYKDGVSVSSGNIGTSSVNTTSNAITIGSYGGGGFPGYISNFRILKGTAVYTSNFTPPTTPLTPIANTSLLTCQSNRLIDYSINNFAITKNGDVTVQRFNPFNPSSLTPTSYSGYFGTANGNGLYLSDTTNGIALSGNYTIEMWLYPTGASSSGYSVITTANGSAGIFQYYYNSAGKIGYYTVSAGAVLTSNAALTFNTWQHVALVRSSNVVKVYVNGVEQTWASAITDSTTVYANYISGIGTTYNIYGYASNFRVTTTAVYTTTFTPPTSPLTAITGTQLLTLQSSTFIDNSTNNYTIYAVGSPIPSIQNPFGFTSATTEGYTVSTIGGSGYFDGSGDYLTVPSNTTLALGSNNFTIEMWVYLTSSNGDFTLFQKPSSYELKVDTSRWVFQVNGSSNVFVTNGTLANNTWTHVALVRNSTATTLYLNGISYTSGTSVNATANSNALVFGSGTSAFGGYITDFRIVNGTALYTSNFVPSSSPLTAIQNTVLLSNMTGAGIYDATTMNDIETVADTKLSTAITKFGGSSVYFDGTGDYLSMAATPVNRINTTGDFTIEFWAYFNTVASDQRLIAWDNNSNNFVIAIYTSSSGVLSYYLSSSGTTWNIAQQVSMGSISATTWTHVALVRNGSTFTPYINGVAGTTTTSSATLTTSTLPFVIGAVGNGSSPYNGYIDDFRITKGYARYTSNFTPPTSAFPIF